MPDQFRAPRHRTRQMLPTCELASAVRFRPRRCCMLSMVPVAAEVDIGYTVRSVCSRLRSWDYMLS
jgi:hypothetical protein